MSTQKRKHIFCVAHVPHRSPKIRKMHGTYCACSTESADFSQPTLERTSSRMEAPKLLTPLVPAPPPLLLAASGASAAPREEEEEEEQACVLDLDEVVRGETSEDISRPSAGPHSA